MRGTAYQQANLLQAETTYHILGEFNTVKNSIIESLEDHNKENANTSRVKVANNASSALKWCAINTYPVSISTNQVVPAYQLDQQGWGFELNL